jgi:Reverse transcriptase (RNA-dependent DNA polymerase)
MDAIPQGLAHPLRWRDIYNEAELYKAAVRVYTKPLFQWRTALSTSTDGKTLYELAERGLTGLAAIHRALHRQEFHFRPALALKYNFNGKRRTLYISPWEERIVDFLLYRLLNRRLHAWFSPHSYAYRDRASGLDRCQARIAAVLRKAESRLYLIKRDVSDYFGSVDHEILLQQVATLVDGRDYLFELLRQRICFAYHFAGQAHAAQVGIPFGAAIACLFANIYLTPLDRHVAGIPGVSYFRYADDLLLLSPDRAAGLMARERLDHALGELRLSTKPSHQADLCVATAPAADDAFKAAREFRHLGLLFRARGSVALSRDKQRKIQNLFRFAFRRGKRRWKKLADPREKAAALAALAREVVEEGARNVAILNYYLKHVNDERQLQSLDRWLAEEVLSLIFGGHKKGHFAKMSFGELRKLGMPSLVHRRRLILNQRVESPFFVWQKQRALRAFGGTVARLRRGSAAEATFSPLPEAATS